MTLTIKFDLDSIKLNQLAKYLGQTSFRYKVIVQKSNRQAETFDRLLYLKLNKKVLFVMLISILPRLHIV